MKYLVCGCTPWAREVFEREIKALPGEWTYLSLPSVVEEYVQEQKFDTVFFLHWRWKVPSEVLKATTCIGFHLGHLPTERGGSPLQWRILAGQIDATLTMFEMTPELDAGDVLDMEVVRLHGCAEAIYVRAMETAAEIIGDYIRDGPRQCRPQLGEGKTYPRRTPAESLLPEELTLTEVYDRIRMVDAAGYPNAYVDYGTLRFTFRRAVEYLGRIEADVTITELPS